MNIEELLRFMVARKASDLHLKAMRPPLLRIDQKLVPAGETALDPEQIREMVVSILTPKQKGNLEEKLWVDLGYSLPGVSRFRVSVTHQRGSLECEQRGSHLSCRNQGEASPCGISASGRECL